MPPLNANFRRYKMAQAGKMLNRDDMVKVLRQGGGVGYGGRVITKESDLPTEAELVQNDPARAAEVAEQLRQSIQALQQQLATVDSLTGNSETRDSEVSPLSAEELQVLAQRAARAGAASPLAGTDGSFLNDDELGAASVEELHPARGAEPTSKEDFGSSSGTDFESDGGNQNSFGLGTRALSASVNTTIEDVRQAANEGVTAQAKETPKPSSRQAAKKAETKPESKPAPRASSSDLVEGK